MVVASWVSAAENRELEDPCLFKGRGLEHFSSVAAVQAWGLEFEPQNLLKS